MSLVIATRSYLLAHRLAQHLEQRGLAGADRAADAHAQRRQLLGAVGDVVQGGGHAVRLQDRKRREYWVSWRADRIGEHRREGLALVVRQRDARDRPRAGISRGQPAEDALAGALAQRHRLDRGAASCSRPSRRRRPGRPRARGASVRAGGEARRRPGRLARRSASKRARAASSWSQLEPFDAGAAHLLGLQQELGRSRGSASTQALSARMRVDVAARQAAMACATHGQVGARQAQVQLVGQPVASGWPRS